MKPYPNFPCQLANTLALLHGPKDPHEAAALIDKHLAERDAVELPQPELPLRANPD